MPLATFALLYDAIDQIKQFIMVLVYLYALLILVYILTSWIRLPYSPWLNRIQRFLYDVCEPYLRIFRRLLPSFGPLDLSPMIGLIVLFLIEFVLFSILDHFH